MALCRHMPVGIVTLTGEAEEMRHHQFGYRLRTACRSIGHGQAFFPGISHIDVVHSHTAATDKTQAWACIDQFLAGRRRAAHEQNRHIVFIDVSPQFILGNILGFHHKSGSFQFLLSDG